MSVLAIAATGDGAVLALPPDQDLLFGRAALDSIRFYGGKPFRLGDHLDRLGRSAQSLSLPPLDRSGVERLILAVADDAGRGDLIVRLYWTSGRDGGLKQPPDGTGPGRAIAVAVPVPDQMEALRRRGISLVSLSTGADGAARTESPWLLGGVKSASPTNAAAWSEARRRGADDAVMVDLHGRVLEGPGTNVWWRTNRVLRTPALDLGILPGITRAAVVELAPQIGYEVAEGHFELADLAAAEEALVTSTAAEVLGAVTLDGRPIGDGTVGPAAVELQRALRDAATAT